jgi:prepilin-type N-terminal cleavage/methylation domain-containing protein
MVKRRTKSGYTLIELMLSVAILGIISSLGAAILMQANRFFSQTTARADLQKEARGVMYIMTRELRQARSASIVVTRSSNAQPYCSQITFTKEQGGSVTFLQKGHQLQMTWGTPVHTETMTKHLQFLAFTFPRTDDMTILSISMTLQTAIFQGRIKTLHTASQQVQVMN